MYFITIIFPWFFKQSQLYPQKPWITQRIILTSIKKSGYDKDSLKKNSVYAISKYKCYKNKLTKIIKAAKRNYYISKFEDVKSEIKQIWQLLKKQ